MRHYLSNFNVYLIKDFKDAINRYVPSSSYLPLLSILWNYGTIGSYRGLVAFN